MLDLKFIQKNPEVVQEAIKKRRMDLSIEDFLKLDSERKSLIQEVESLRSQLNTQSREVGRLKAKGEDVTERVRELGELSERIKGLEKKKKEIEARLFDIRARIPNIPAEDVPEGDSDEDNVEIKRWGERPHFDFEPRAHWDIGNNLKGLDFERAAKIAGSRFTLYFGWAARLERALINFMLDIHTKEHGYLEVLPPFMVNYDTMFGTGQLPKFEEDLFKIKDWDYYLIPTAEVPVTNIHRDEVLREEDLPIAYTAYTPCFRSEAGSYGKDTRGLIRQHQFNKVELVRFSHPEESYNQLEILLSHAETILQRLNLHYRVVILCTGDLGFSASKTYDIEVWLPGQNTYREISSCSNFEDFQARRANIRFQLKNSRKKAFVHTLNGSGLAVGRCVVAILENYQQKDGSVVIPEALRPYMDGIEVIEAK